MISPSGKNSSESPFSQAGPYRAVLCSRASDLDSVVSAVITACLLNHTEGGALHSAAVVPISRCELSLRREVIRLFSEAEIPTDIFCCLDDPSTEQMLADPLTRFVLVDHNRPDRDLHIPPDRVDLIIDHHRDEGDFPRAERIIQPAGSTASLVTDLVRSRAPGLLDSRAALLLAGAVILDTVCLSDEFGRCTETDRQAASVLLDITGADAKELYEMLRAEKFSCRGMSAEQLLLRDYKEFQQGAFRIGMCSVPMSLAGWMQETELLDIRFMEFLRQHQLTVLTVMSAFYQDQQFFRQLSVTTDRSDLLYAVPEYLHRKGADLNHLLTAGNTAVYSQGNTTYSRKIIQPLLSEFFCSSGG